MTIFLVIYSKMSVYPDKFTAVFCVKSHHFLTYFLYMIRYNNVSLSVHNPPAQNLGVVTPPTPQD